MAEFGRAKLKFLKRFLKLRHGMPSHDTFSTVVSASTWFWPKSNGRNVDTQRDAGR